MWLLPSLARPANLARFFDAYRLTGGSTPGMVLVDIEDWQSHLDAYNALDLPLGWRLHLTDGVTQGDKIREVWNQVKDCAWLGLIGDDNIPETPGWDRRMVDALDGWNLVSCNDAWQAPKRVANCWVMSGDLVREVGYIFPPGMHHLFVDDVWEAIGRDAECWTCLMDVTVRHAHVLKGEAPVDATHEAVYGKGIAQEGSLWPEDDRTFHAWMRRERNRIASVVKKHRTAIVDAMMSAPEPLTMNIQPSADGFARLARAKTRNVMICTPVYREISVVFHVAMMETVASLERLGIKYICFMPRECANLAAARNTCAAAFLASACTDMIFIDADMGWHASDLVRLLSSEQKLIGGAGRRRTEKPNSDLSVWCAHFLPDAHRQFNVDEMGAIEVSGVGTGFVKISREVFEALIAAHPDWKMHGAQGYNEKNAAWYYNFFRFDVIDGRQSGEDYGFCRSWREAGGTVWLDPSIWLTHVGSNEWSGSIAEIMASDDDLLNKAAE